MKWVLVVLVGLSNGKIGREVVEDGFRSQEHCMWSLERMSGDRDWVLECVPQKPKMKRSCYYHRYVATGDSC